jgi:hypothetical protein
MRDCYHCANRCLDMWNDCVDHAARSELLRMADAWLQLALKLDDPATLETAGASNLMPSGRRAEKGAADVAQ